MEKSLDVVVIAQYSGNGGQSNNRFREVCRNLVKSGVKTELITSSFLHSHKEQIDLVSSNLEKFEIVQIEEPGYIKNVSLQRIWSHHVLAKNLEEYLDVRKTPDVIYCAVPSLSLAEAALKYAKRKNVRLILDIQDLWPDAFEILLRPKWLARLLLTPLRMQANRVYTGANEIVTVSETYSSRIMQTRSLNTSIATVYLGTNLELFDLYPEKPWDVGAEVIHIAYIGTLGHNYDLPLVFEALRILRDEGLKFKMHIMGNGPLETSWIEMADDLSDEVIFHGRLEYSEMVARLKSCDIAINPIVPGAAGSIINKVCDYAAAGLPVVNTQENTEYRHMISEFESGINCESTPDSVASAILLLAKDEKYRSKLSLGSRKLAETNFDRSRTYEQITELILYG